jgi:hypothetical protein
LIENTVLPDLLGRHQTRQRAQAPIHGLSRCDAGDDDALRMMRRHASDTGLVAGFIAPDLGPAPPRQGFDGLSPGGN